MTGSRLCSDALCLSGEGELQQQLYLCLRQQLLSGRWPAGALLPSERQLASDLALSRTTVQQALQQLVAEGYVEAQHGRGYQIVDALPDRYFTPEPVHALTGTALPVQPYGLKPKGLDFSGRLQPGQADVHQFPFRVWQQLLQRHGNRPALCGMADPLGDQPLRQALAQYLRQSRQLVCDEDTILITAGAQQALFIAAKLAARSNEQVLMESPGYPRLKQALQLAELKIHPIPANTATGLDPAGLPTAGTARALFLTPSHQYPCGGIMPLAKRLELLSWAKHQQCWLVEDDYDSEFQYRHRPIASLQGLAQGEGVLFVGSFSKTLFPALRLGYLVAPKAHIRTASTLLQALQGDVALLPQAVLADFINEGHFQRHLRKMRRHYHQQKQLASTLLAAHFPDARLLAQDAGLHLTLLLPTLRDDIALCSQLSQHGFKVQPFSRYCFLNEAERGLVIGIADADEAQLLHLSRLLKNYLDP
ncbi:PLP-dependent aminotransferase family protein [Alkalimonas sp. MEB108]|uniref:PLP-dependent aminotransferase family protein n=1 Tax=Alkalimonas cellulosilytica TaxID=3058395 RepID=A0ABU7J0T6_9GAMM|nr:PLP-dependent aminotransferase family protein [Alkalimonas sp. MEB108]MEE2000116.1 PLP-dependent aminotransferase family protein [Alkalimonas sp. MEB108]